MYVCMYVYMYICIIHNSDDVLIRRRSQDNHRTETEQISCQLVSASSIRQNSQALGK